MVSTYIDERDELTSSCYGRSEATSIKQSAQVGEQSIVIMQTLRLTMPSDNQLSM